MNLRFLKNEGSNRSKNNKKRGQLDRKSRGQLVYKMLQNGQMTDFGDKYTTFCQITMGLNAIGTNHFFLQKERSVRSSWA